MLFEKISIKKTSRSLTVINAFNACKDSKFEYRRKKCTYRILAKLKFILTYYSNFQTCTNDFRRKMI